MNIQTVIGLGCAAFAFLIMLTFLVINLYEFLKKKINRRNNNNGKRRKN